MKGCRTAPRSAVPARERGHARVKKARAACVRGERTSEGNVLNACSKRGDGRRRVAVGRVAQAQLALTVPPPARDARVVKDRACVMDCTRQTETRMPQRVREETRESMEGMRMCVLWAVTALPRAICATLVPSAVTAVGVVWGDVVWPKPSWPLMFTPQHETLASLRIAHE